MSSKLWKKGYSLNQAIEAYTVGNDYELDLQLIPYDCQASLVHAEMLHSINLLDDKELEAIRIGLNEILNLHEKQQFIIKQEDEDGHTAIENYLTEKYGEVGKKIHSARSRNDQVLTALRLFEKDQLQAIKQELMIYQSVLINTKEKIGTIPIPGYTHMQRAMPTTVGIWLDSFSASVTDDLLLLDAVYHMINQSPLGTAAGYGVPVLPINRSLTSDALKFDRLLENPIYAQFSRGKFEGTVVHLLGQIMLGLNKMANDLLLFSTTEFGFVNLPVEFCTGSSIMPQKKNLDVLELVRAKYHIVSSEEFKIKAIMANLISGYNRDIQLIKEPVMNSFSITHASIYIMRMIVEHLTFNEEACRSAMTQELYATERAYELVLQGIPFREAYRIIANSLEK